MARCEHYVEAFDCCAKISEFIEDVLWVKSCYYKDDVCPNCRYFEEKEDVVPVVRCKDCEYYYRADKDTCLCTHKKNLTFKTALTISREHYCSYGKRRCSDE